MIIIAIGEILAATDPSETTNLYTSKPEIAATSLKQIESVVQRGRLTTKSAATSDLEKIKLWKPFEETPVNRMKRLFFTH